MARDISRINFQIPRLFTRCSADKIEILRLKGFSIDRALGTEEFRGKKSTARERDVREGECGHVAS